MEKKYANYINYILIGVVSFIALVFLPFLGTKVGLGFNLPDTAAGWILYIVKQLLGAVINVLIFHNFILQARVNIKDNPYYIEAEEILRTNKEKGYKPRSLAQFNKREYGLKGVSIFLFSILSVFALSQALLTYDYMLLISYVLTVGCGLVFGLLEMKKYEQFYVGEYLDYAREVKKANEEALALAKEASNQPADDFTDLDRGINILESSDNSGTDCTN